jgi:hypothetical protein
VSPRLESVRLLLSDAIDYAGLFPPASLTLAETTARYGTYRASPAAWALGRLVVPGSRLEELRPLMVPSQGPWRLSVLLGPDVGAEIQAARTLASTAVHIESLEGRAADPAGVSTLADAVRRDADGLGAALYVEIPLHGDPVSCVEAARRAGVRAKARTGGVTAEAIPDPAAILRFLDTCVCAGVPFKVTAGLHHAVRGSHPLTYENGAVCAPMHGFLNVFVGAAFLVAGTPASRVAAVLEETDAPAFRFTANGVAWRDLHASLDDIRRARDRLVSFGSCSFEEPLAELHALRLS